MSRLGGRDEGGQGYRITGSAGNGSGGDRKRSFGGVGGHVKPTFTVDLGRYAFQENEGRLCGIWFVL